MSRRVSPSYMVHLAILKGCVEHGDTTFYLGSTLSHADFICEVIEMGWMHYVSKVHPTGGFEFDALEATLKGHHIYAKEHLSDLPRKGRWYAWDWELALA